MRLPVIHLSLSVADLDRSVDFYRRVFAADVGRQTERFVDLWIFGCQLTLYRREPVTPDRHDHFGATVDPEEFWALVGRATDDGGATIVFSPRHRHQGTAQEETKLMLADPDGHLIELKTYADPEAALRPA